MPKHISKMEDGHFLVETDEEYKKRTGGGCLGTIGAIVIVVLIVFSKCDNDDKPSDKTPTTEITSQQSETKPAEPSKSVESLKAAASNAAPTINEYIEEDIPVVGENTKTSGVKPDSPIENESVEGSTTSDVDIEAAVKQVSDLYKTATIAIKEGNNDDALKALEEMKAIQAEMPKKVNRINDKIRNLEKKIK